MMKTTGIPVVLGIDRQEQEHTSSPGSFMGMLLTVAAAEIAQEF
jgi:hypothetical protein